MTWKMHRRPTRHLHLVGPNMTTVATKYRRKTRLIKNQMRGMKMRKRPNALSCIRETWSGLATGSDPAASRGDWRASSRSTPSPKAPRAQPMTLSMFWAGSVRVSKGANWCTPLPRRRDLQTTAPAGEGGRRSVIADTRPPVMSQHSNQRFPRTTPSQRTTRRPRRRGPRHHQHPRRARTGSRVRSPPRPRSVVRSAVLQRTIPSPRRRGATYPS
mmetsp:Transcript_13083/g.30992  ORF Transcript_13083/g.30992 Transcript_13083/m.30992 type:complete len:215 (+) Transcript_13083:324-968(+)